MRVKSGEKIAGKSLYLRADLEIQAAGGEEGCGPPPWRVQKNSLGLRPSDSPLVLQHASPIGSEVSRQNL